MKRKLLGSTSRWSLLVVLFSSLGLISAAGARPIAVGACSVELPGGWLPGIQSDTRLLAKGVKEGQGCSVFVEVVPGTTAADPNDPNTQASALSDLRQDGDHILETKIVTINGQTALVALAHKLDPVHKLSLVVEIFFTPGKNYYITATSTDEDPRTDGEIKAFLASPTFK